MIIVDTGFWLALINSEDVFHQAAVKQLKKVREPLITTVPVLTECVHLISRRIGSGGVEVFLKMWSLGGMKVFSVGDQHASRMMSLMNQYKNLPMDFVDASLVILAEDMGLSRILTVDRKDFSIYRIHGRQIFENLFKTP